VALLAFKASITNADQVAQLATWVSGTDPCTWGGTIGCKGDGTITDIKLSSTSPQMIGQISGSLATPALQTLVNIDLSGNALSGSIPDAFAGNNALPNLVILNLSNNQLSGGPGNLGANSECHQSSFC